MSAFVVSPQTMHNVVATMRNDVADLDTLNQLGRDLFAMNIEAVCQRYPDCRDNPENMPGPIDQQGVGEGYCFNPAAASPCAIARYKAARCLRYQCNEGDVPESEQYAKLNDAINEMANAIVSTLPEFEHAGWDVVPEATPLVA